MTVPEVRYTKAPDGVHLAYQAFGEGTFDLFVLPGGWTHLELRWEEPSVAKAWRRLASFARVITFDRRGVGLSDRVGPKLAVEDQVGDALAVLDAAESESTAVVGTSTAGPLAMLLSAAHPGRVRALVLQSTYARTMAAADYPSGLSEEAFALLWDVADRGDFRAFLKLVAPAEAADARFWAWWEHYARSSLGPGDLLEELRVAHSTDVRSALGSILAPTTVLHHEDQAWPSLEDARVIAAGIPGAHLKVLPGAGVGVFRIDARSWIQEVEALLTGTRRADRLERALTTVLFTDLVASTEHAVALGDEHWRDLLEAHERAVRGTVEEFDGRVVKSTGDGHLIVFDRPAAGVECALSLVRSVRSLGIELRAGLHIGEVEIVGADVAGLTVHVAARVAALGNAGEVLVSRTVRDLLVGSSISFSERGTQALKGIPEEWQIYEVTST